MPTPGFSSDGVDLSEEPRTIGGLVQVLGSDRPAGRPWPPELPKGTTLYWPQGPVAGTVETPTTPRLEQPSARSDRRCYRWSMVLHAASPDNLMPGWTFCVDAAAIGPAVD